MRTSLEVNLHDLLDALQLHHLRMAQSHVKQSLVLYALNPSPNQHVPECQYWHCQ